MRTMLGLKVTLHCELCGNSASYRFPMRSRGGSEHVRAYECALFEAQDDGWRALREAVGEFVCPECVIAPTTPEVSVRMSLDQLLLLVHA